MPGERPPQDLIDKIAELERRIAELERRIAQTPKPAAPAHP